MHDCFSGQSGAGHAAFEAMDGALYAVVSCDWQQRLRAGVEPHAPASIGAPAIVDQPSVRAVAGRAVAGRTVLQPEQ